MQKAESFIMVFLASLLFFYSFGLCSIFNALQPYITQAFATSLAMTGMISSMFFYAEIALLIPAGLIIDKVSARNMISLSLLLSALGAILTAYSHTIMMLIFARLLMGIGGAFSFIGCVRIAANWLRADLLARGMSLIVTMGIFGGVIAQMPFTYLIKQLGWREALIAVGIFGLLIAAIVYFFLKDKPKDFIMSQAAQETNALNVFQRFKLAFLNKQNILCGLYTSLMNLPLCMLGAMWGMSYLVSVNGISGLQASAVCGMIFIGTMFGSPLAGLISDKLVSRTIPMKWGAVLSLILMFALIISKISNITVLLSLYFLLGLITSTQVISYPTVVESNSKGISSSATSVISILSMLGGAIMQPLFGYIVYNFSITSGVADMQGYKAAMWLLPLSFVISLLVSCLIKETHCKSID